MPIRQFAARHELKYIVDEHKARGIRQFVRAHLGADPFSADSEGYPVSSIYLDSSTYELYSQTDQGLRNRFKLRVRYYDNAPDSPVFFEIKRREGAIIRKQRAAVDRDLASQLLRGMPLPATGIPSREMQALTEFCRLRDRTRAYQYTYVGYRREAFGSNSLSQVRVTFDRALAAGTFNADQPFLVREPEICPDLGGVVLELKFTDRFPRWMHDLVRTFNLNRISVPKYNTCVDAIGGRRPQPRLGTFRRSVR